MKRQKTFSKIVGFLIKKTNVFFYQIAKCIFFLLPIRKNKIVFHEGRGYGDNPKYIADEILKQNLNYELVWILDNLKSEVPIKIRKVKLGTIKALFEVSTAHIFVDDGKNGLLNLKKKEQFYIQTWHGDFALKFIEKEAEAYLPLNYIENSKKDSKSTDVILSASSMFTGICSKNFWLPDSCKVQEIGQPRNDIYFHDESFKNQLRKKYGFDTELKILLYAPTFRDDNSINGYFTEFQELKQSLESCFREKWLVIVRMHENAVKLASNIKYDDSVINGTFFPDAQELSVISDALITDYSSIMADFFIMKKPVFLYVKDLEQYNERSRGLRQIFYELPVTYSKNIDELKTNIETFDKDKYLFSLNDFMQNRYVSYDDGHASERVVNLIKGKIVL